jgi:hypothetical protein
MEGVEALTHGLQVAIQLLSQDAGAPPIPAADPHARMQDPIGGGIQTASQPPPLAFFYSIAGWASSEHCGPGTPPGPRLPA